MGKNHGILMGCQVANNDIPTEYEWNIGEYPPVSSDLTCWKIHNLVRWFSQLETSIDIQFSFAMVGYQRVHHEQPCKAKAGKPNQNWRWRWTWREMDVNKDFICFGFDGLNFNSFFHMMCKNDGKPSNMFKHWNVNRCSWSSSYW